jgi:DNA-binding XRE family transcriptional regulator
VEPELRFLPAILRFLGYDPRPAPATLGGQIRAAREAAGLSERELARRLGLDPGTLAAWERDEVRRPYPRIRRVFERWLVSVGAERAVYGSVNSALGAYQERR